MLAAQEFHINVVDSEKAMCIGDSNLQDACLTAEFLLSLPTEAQPDSLSLSLQRKSRESEEKRRSYSDHVNCNGRENRLSCNDRLRQSLRDLMADTSALQKDDLMASFSSISVGTTSTRRTYQSDEKRGSINFQLRRSISNVSNNNSRRLSRSVMDNSVHSLGSFRGLTTIIVESSCLREEEQGFEAKPKLTRRISDLSLDSSTCSSSFSSRRSLNSNARRRNSSNSLNSNKAGFQTSLSSLTLNNDIAPGELELQAEKTESTSKPKPAKSRRCSNHKVDAPMAALLHVANKNTHMSCASLLNLSGGTLLGSSDHLDASCNSVSEELTLESSRRVSAQKLEAASSEMKKQKQKSRRRKRIGRKDSNMSAKSSSDLPGLIASSQVMGHGQPVEHVGSKLLLKRSSLDLSRQIQLSTRNSNSNLTSLSRSATLPRKRKGALTTNPLGKTCNSDLRSPIEITKSNSRHPSQGNLKLVATNNKPGSSGSGQPKQRASRRDRMKAKTAFKGNLSDHHTLSSRNSNPSLAGFARSSTHPVHIKSACNSRNLALSKTTTTNGNIMTFSRSTTFPAKTNASSNSLRNLMNATEAQPRVTTLSSKSSLSDLNALLKLKRVKPRRKKSNSDLKKLLQATSGSEVTDTSLIVTSIKESQSIEGTRSRLMSPKNQSTLCHEMSAKTLDNDVEGHRQSATLQTTLEIKPRTKRSSSTKLDLLAASMTSIMNSSNNDLLNESFRRSSRMSRRRLSPRRDSSLSMMTTSFMEKGDSNRTKLVRSLNGSGENSSNAGPAAEQLSPKLASYDRTATKNTRSPKRGVHRTSSLGEKLELLAALNQRKKSFEQEQRSLNQAKRSFESFSLPAAVSCVNSQAISKGPSPQSPSSSTMTKNVAGVGLGKKMNTSLSNVVEQVSTSEALRSSSSLRSLQGGSRTSPGSKLSSTAGQGNPTLNAACRQRNSQWSTPPNPRQPERSAPMNNPFSSIVNDSISCVATASAAANTLKSDPFKTVGSL